MNFLDRLSPLIARIRPKFGLSNDYRSAADRSWIIGPGMEGESPAAICEPSDLLKVTGVHAIATTIEEQLGRTQRRRVSHRPTTAYELRDVVLVDGNLYNRKALYFLSGCGMRWVAPANLPHHESASLAVTDWGKRYFGHWMWDDLPLHLAAREIAPPVSTITTPSSSQRDYARLLGLESIVLADGYFERLVVIDDGGQNANKRARYHRLRDLSPFQAATAAAGVMLIRGKSGARRVLVNEDEVAQLVRRRGFLVLDPSTMSAEELMTSCMKAPVVLGVEGSHMANGMMWMSYTGTVVAIMPPQRFETIMKDRCDCLGINFALIVADQVSETDFSVDTNALNRLLDRVAPLSTVDAE